jgi:hypothetical protein
MKNQSLVRRLVSGGRNKPSVPNLQKEKRMKVKNMFILVFIPKKIIFKFCVSKRVSQKFYLQVLECL